MLFDLELIAHAVMPSFRTPEAAVGAFGNIASFYQNQLLLQQTPPPGLKEAEERKKEAFQSSPPLEFRTLVKSTCLQREKSENQNQYLNHRAYCALRDYLPE